ncbi:MULTISPECIES: zinc ribbon domain-containing protein [Staphylococcus]|uniref:zinc ribbon domain-containing protein n=1 Tax=Staphylococcus TaxID=1279 RepID=UPI0002464368|nr:MULTISPECIES: zinc ribbon domain-containing protein [Staphylococcus]QAV30553.1 zinc ribbon domain-containing protein [Sulfitobacter donghicola]AGZ25395.1 hypothetical protein STP1_1091 [Staphylococcus pasteuri SP1]KAB7643490.1 zinc ribbon domain-containing protein [Staphylococcus sp. B2-b]MBN6853477.1 zinc ribbon domain-containing protein [Staphylococcus warneri]MBT2770242.1 zinc ribbon domain-containing protein [Staphylococcus warneri]
MKCPNCGQNYQQEDQCCGHCGYQLTRQNDHATTSTTASTMKETQQYSTQTNDDNVESRRDKENFKRGTTSHQTKRKLSTLGENDAHFEEIMKDKTASFEHKMKDLKDESKQFFNHVFKSSDQSDVIYSYRLLVTLMCAGLFLSTLLVIILSSDIFLLFPESSPFKAIFYMIVIILGSLALSVSILYGIVKYTFTTAIEFHKVFSDYIAINTFSVLALMIGLVLGILSIFKLALIIMLLAFVLLYMVSPTYILVKYSGVYPTKIASIYGIIIYQFVMMVMVYLLGHMIIQQIINDYLMKLFGSGFSGLL